MRQTLIGDPLLVVESGQLAGEAVEIARRDITRALAPLLLIEQFDVVPTAVLNARAVRGGLLPGEARMPKRAVAGRRTERAIDNLDVANPDLVGDELPLGAEREPPADRALEVSELGHSHRCVRRSEPDPRLGNPRQEPLDGRNVLSRLRAARLGRRGTTSARYRDPHGHKRHHDQHQPDRPTQPPLAAIPERRLVLVPGWVGASRVSWLGRRGQWCGARR